MGTNVSLNLPRGIRVFTEQGRKHPHGCQWTVASKRKTRFFEKIGPRDDFAKELAGGAKEHGSAAFTIDAAELLAFRAYKAQQAARTGTAPTIAKAVPQYIQAKTAEGLSKAAMSHYASALKKLVEAMGRKPVDLVTREQMAEWSATLEGEDSTRRTMFVRARGLFTWLKFARIIAENPFDGLKPTKVIAKRIVLLSPQDGAKLFKMNAAPNVRDHRELCGRMALEAFAGLRYRSAAGIIADDIKFSMKGIELPADNIKTERRKFIQHLPNNLWAWLKWADPTDWKMTARQYLQAKSHAFIRAGIDHPRNCLRKGFATYHLAALGDAGRTAAILCHTNLKKLMEDYNGVADTVSGKKWLAIFPPKGQK